MTTHCKVPHPAGPLDQEGLDEESSNLVTGLADVVGPLVGTTDENLLSHEEYSTCCVNRVLGRVYLSVSHFTVERMHAKSRLPSVAYFSLSVPLKDQ